MLEYGWIKRGEDRAAMHRYGQIIAGVLRLCPSGVLGKSTIEKALHGLDQMHQGKLTNGRPSNYIRAQAYIMKLLLMGVLPLRSHRHAEFLHNEVPGISVPDEIRERLRLAGDGAAEVGIDLGRELLDEVSGIVDGVYFMPQFGRYDSVLDVLAGAKVIAERTRDGEAMAQ